VHDYWSKSSNIKTWVQGKGQMASYQQQYWLKELQAEFTLNTSLQLNALGKTMVYHIYIFKQACATRNDCNIELKHHSRRLAGMK